MFIHHDEALSGIDYLTHGFFGRTGGVSKDGYESLNASLSTKDSPENIKQNKQIIARALDVGEISICKQVHGIDAVHVTKITAEQDMPEADAMVTEMSEIALGIKTADCAPVLMASTKKPIVAAVHAGWGGAFKGVVEAAIDRMCYLGADIKDIVCAIGPCIHQQSYEVDEEFYTKFFEQNEENCAFFIPSQREGRYMFSLPRYIEKKIKSYAPYIKNVSIAPYDTYEHDDLFFSHRRATHEGNTDIGRQLSVISIKG